MIFFKTQIHNSPNQDEIVYKDSGSIIWEELLWCILIKTLLCAWLI